MGDVTESDMITVKVGLKHLDRNAKEFKEDVKGQLKDMDGKLDTVLAFMATQLEKNEHAEKERDRIFKASTLLPVAILTSVISGTVSYMFKSSSPPTKTPDQNTYIMPSRQDPKYPTELKIRGENS